VPRGRAEPELEGVEELRQFRFSWAEARQAVKKRTMWFLFAQGFAGVFPWNVITFFFFGYLVRERGYDNDSVLFTMAPVILILAAGYFVGGALGDLLFKRTLRGRVIVSSAGVLLGAVFLFLAIRTPVEARTTFFVYMCLTAIFMPMSSARIADLRCHPAEVQATRPSNTSSELRQRWPLRPDHCRRREPGDRHPVDLAHRLAVVFRHLPGGAGCRTGGHPGFTRPTAPAG
jgi:hypothetical protein